MTALTTLSIPSPADGVWNLGPLPLRGYAVAIILGIVAAIWLSERRWEARGGTRGEMSDLAVWAVPFGIVGARLYHVVTDPDRYFGADGSLWEILYVWQGGLGVWGGIAMGAVGVVVGCKVRGIKVLPVLDTMAPTVLVAQAFGRWGNWFNQELFGRPTDLPWGLEIDPDNRPLEYADQATYHPTFLYESLWCLAAFAVIVWVERRRSLGHGRVLALYVMAYTAGRGWIEMLRIDDVQLDDVLGLRLNVWTSIVLFVLAAAWFVHAGRRWPGREDVLVTDRYTPPEPATRVASHDASPEETERPSGGPL
jgi:prolipoprotein diacylglyceryl transferase